MEQESYRADGEPDSVQTRPNLNDLLASTRPGRWGISRFFREFSTFHGLWTIATVRPSRDFDA